MPDEGDSPSAAPPPEPAELAVRWTHECVRERLNGLGVTPLDLHTALSGSESSWRGKLNGNRHFNVTDLVLIAMAVDGDFFAQPPFSSPDLTGFFPPEFHARLSHTALGDGMPTLASPTADWRSITLAVATWMTSERTAGRAWLIDTTGLARQLLVAAADSALPSTTATLAATTDTGIDIEWVGRGLLLRVTSSPPLLTAGIASADLRRAHEQFANDLADLTAAQQRDKVLVTVMAPQALAALREIMDLPEASANDWSVVGLDRLHRLGPTHAATGSILEVHLHVVAHDRDSGTLCLRIK